jgi:hypothetical protein
MGALRSSVAAGVRDAHIRQFASCAGRTLHARSLLRRYAVAAMSPFVEIQLEASRHHCEKWLHFWALRDNNCTSFRL